MLGLTGFAPVPEGNIRGRTDSPRFSITVLRTESLQETQL